MHSHTDSHGDSWEHLPKDVTEALSATIGVELPPRALALYARWWQFEKWLRDLTYVELRSRDGLTWADNIDNLSKERQNKEYEFMASPDWENPLSYTSATTLFKIIEQNWNLFTSTLLTWKSWEGRKDEILAIRNRIGHLRRPHEDDLNRLEQTLRDLERGAFRAISSYNRWMPIENISENDPLINQINNGEIGKVVKHIKWNDRVNVRISYTIRPWKSPPHSDDPVSENPGLLWDIGFHGSPMRYDIPKLWRDLSQLTRQLLIHALVPDLGTIRFTFPAVDNPELAEVAILDVINTALNCGRPIEFEEIIENNSYFNTNKFPMLDSRVQMQTAWTLVDDSTVPVSIFSA